MPRWLLVTLAVALAALAAAVAFLMLVVPGVQPGGGYPSPDAYPWAR